MFVASQSKVKGIAAIIARMVRSEEEQPPVLSAVGASSVNQAVKAIAIARTYVSSDNISLVVEAERKPQEDVRDVIVLTIEKKVIDENTETPVETYTEMKASAKSIPTALAGAIAANIREDKIPRITAIGKGAVFRAICAVSIARRYMKKEDVDLHFFPKFIEVDFDNGTKANALQITVVKMT